MFNSNIYSRKLWIIIICLDLKSIVHNNADINTNCNSGITNIYDKIILVADIIKITKKSSYPQALVERAIVFDWLLDLQY